MQSGEGAKGRCLPWSKEEEGAYTFWMKQVPVVLSQISFLTAPRCQFRGVDQGMKQTYLYLWYPLFQAQWDRCVQQNHQLLELHECINLERTGSDCIRFSDWKLENATFAEYSFPIRLRGPRYLYLNVAVEKRNISGV
jgi:hypothetical protein